MQAISFTVKNPIKFIDLKNGKEHILYPKTKYELNLRPKESFIREFYFLMNINEQQISELLSSLDFTQKKVTNGLFFECTKDIEFTYTYGSGWNVGSASSLFKQGRFYEFIPLTAYPHLTFNWEHNLSFEKTYVTELIKKKFLKRARNVEMCCFDKRPCSFEVVTRTGGWGHTFTDTLCTKCGKHK